METSVPTEGYSTSETKVSTGPGGSGQTCRLEEPTPPVNGPLKGDFLLPSESWGTKPLVVRVRKDSKRYFVGSIPI